jgi:hypothetical protein
MEKENYDAGWRPWPVAWSAVWVGTLAALAVGLIIGLIGFAVGAHQAARFATGTKVRFITMIFNVGGAFFAAVVGGWVAASIAGIRRSEPAMLHGAIVWALGIPILLVLASLGATSYFGSWYGGLAGTPAWVAAGPPVAPEQAAAMRNAVAGTVVGLLLGLIGSVLGGWMASGEPMTLTYYRRRDIDRREQPPRRST